MAQVSARATPSKMKLLRTLFLYAALAGCLTTAALAQITAFSYQGRLTDGGAPANGLYDFTLSAHDALTSGNLVGSALIFADVPVTNGVFVLYPDFGAGALTGQPRWLEVGVRIGASTGAYTPLNPRQPILATPLANVANTVLSLPAGVVGGAQLAPGSITADKLAPSITTLGLAPSGALLTSFDENATHLTSNGYVKIPGLSTTVGGWNVIPERNAQTNLSTGYSMYGPASLWTGTELFVYSISDYSGPAGNRFNPATGLWNPVPTNGQPSFNNNGTASLLQGGSDVFVFGRVDPLMNPNSIGGIFNLTSGGWRNIPTNGLPSIANNGPRCFWTGSEVLAIGDSDSGQFYGALFSPLTNGWRLIDTNGNPQVRMETSTVLIAGWTGTELFLYGNSRANPGEMAGGLYHPANGTWRPASINNGPQLGDGSGRTGVWTGTEWITYAYDGEMAWQARLFAYNPQMDAWRPCSTVGAPWSDMSYGFGSLFWTGTEVAEVISRGSDGTGSGGATVCLYQPATDSWRSFESLTPSLASSMTVPRLHWTGSEGVGYLTESSGGAAPSTVRPYRFTPPRALFLYQKP